MFFLIVALVIVPFVVAVSTLGLRRFRILSTILLYLPPTLAALSGLYLWTLVSDSTKPVVKSLAWMPSLGIDASIRADRLGVFFVLLTGFIGLGVVHYSRYYFNRPPSVKYWCYLFAFMGSMLGVVVSDSLILLFVFWEMTTMTSALLIAGERPDAKSIRGAIQAFLVTGLGGLSLLAGIVLLGKIAGTFNLSELETLAPDILKDPFHQTALVLIALGAFAKSAQWPLHFWLPGAMSAPAPISAYLHSATMVNAGVFLLGRMVPILGQAVLWQPLLSIVGVVTFLIASWKAFRVSDLKELLAYSTVAYLGVLTILYAYAPQTGATGELLHFANHALYKSSLFLLLGWFERISGTRNISVLDEQRWWPRQPFGASLFVVAGLAMVGGPFLLGYHSKKIFSSTVLTNSGFDVITLIAFAGSVLTVAVTLKMIVPAFWGTKKVSERSSASLWLLIVPTILLLPQIIGGIVPNWIFPISEPASEWPGGLTFWKQADLNLIVKLATFVLGIVLFLFWRHISRVQAAIPMATIAQMIARACLLSFTRFGNVIQAGGHPRYLAFTSVAVVAMVLTAAAVQNAFYSLPSIPSLSDSFTNIALIPTALIIPASILANYFRKRITSLLMIAVVGFSLVIFYSVFRAPDVAMTQVLVETISLVLILLAFKYMPEFSRDTRRPVQKVIHIIIAGATGLCMTLMTLIAGGIPPVVKTGDFLLELAVPEAKGRNVINVTLVDFRAADTLGEIAVLAIATIGIVASLSTARFLKRDKKLPTSEIYSTILAALTRVTIPVAGIFAIYLLLRGHNEPGGGFIAGLVCAAALLLFTRTSDFQAFKTKLTDWAITGIWIGLVLAAGSGLIPLLFGDPVLTHYHSDFPSLWPTLSTTLIFDIGVFLTVIGTTTVMLTSFKAEGEPPT